MTTKGLGGNDFMMLLDIVVFPSIEVSMSGKPLFSFTGKNGGARTIADLYVVNNVKTSFPVSGLLPVMPAH